ncbi:hypothetical protein [Dactylosporangium sp. NPDC051541]|uniref:hypothetical protein n=1 Tax=Dactylosporangium sp. NPDC051541 TaxID=3363977 RepID=UPI00378FEEC0
MNRWWYVVAALFLISIVFMLLAGVRVVRANPSVRVPLFGRAPSLPVRAAWLRAGAVGAAVLGVVFFGDAMRKVRPGDEFAVVWCLPLVAFVLTVGLMPYLRHNRRVRRQAVQVR